MKGIFPFTSAKLQFKVTFRVVAGNTIPNQVMPFAGANFLSVLSLVSCVNS